MILIIISLLYFCELRANRGKMGEKKQLKTKSRLKQVYHEKFDGIMQYHCLLFFLLLLPSHLEKTDLN
jgi:hypothetical protein